MSGPTTITINASSWARVTRERDEAREAFAIATNNCVDAQQDLRKARDREEKLLQEVAALKSQISNLQSP